MIVQILDQQHHFENREESVGQVLELIQSLTEKENLLVGQLVINGESVYSDFDDYLTRHLAEIETICVIAKSPKEILDEMIITAVSYINRVFADINPLADKFYQGKQDEIWENFLGLMEGLEWILTLLKNLGDNKALYSNWLIFLEYAGKTEEQLYGIEEALNYQDLTLVGDIMLFEIIPILEVLHKEFDKTVGGEVKKYDLN